MSFDYNKISIQDAKVRWEKAFNKEMTTKEYIMFSWGYTYALSSMKVRK